MAVVQGKTLTRRVITQQEIADIAGVGRSTVAYALQGKPNVSKDTKDRILKICNHYNYLPNYLGRSLKNKKTDSIFVVVPDIGNTYFSDQLLLLAEKFGNKGFDVYPQFLGNTKDNESLILSLGDGKARGVVCFGKNYEMITACETLAGMLPVVVLGNIDGKYSGISTDLFHSGVLAGNHLISKGRKRLLFMGNQSSYFGKNSNFAGFERAVVDAGLDKPEKLILDTRVMNPTKTISYEAGYIAARKIIKEHNNIDGIFCFTDHYAMGLICGLIELGVKVPEDIAIVGHDNSRDSLFAKVELTTIQYPFEQIISTACEILLSEIDNFPNYVIERKEYKCTLIERKSTEPNWVMSENIQQPNNHLQFYS